MSCGDGFGRVWKEWHKLKLWKKMDWMFFHSVCKHPHQSLLPAFTEYGMSDCEPCYPCLYFEEE